ncbi:tRNA methyltransferase ppm2 [Myotisia sp. PD_48]|nr:tRNA methyltransferase ppm2 [Myotisia sp. PD_48]
MGQSTGLQSEKEAGLVMGTNGSSIVSKRSVERIYYPEPHFFRYFVKKPQRRSPLINRGYWLRMYAVENAVKQFLDRPSDRPKLVLNFGCGFDPLPFQLLSRDPNGCRNAKFIDIDHHKLMAEKKIAIAKNKELHNLIPDVVFPQTTTDGGVVISGCQYAGIGCDLGNLKGLEEALRSELDPSNFSILCTAEVSLTYMDVQSADALIAWASKLSEDTQFCLLEQYFPDGPDHPFAKTMMAHFNKLGTPLYSIHKYPTLALQQERFLRANWKSAQARSLWDLWSDPHFLDSERRISLDGIEAFDEWEEFALFSSHYFVLEAHTRSGISSENIQMPRSGHRLADSGHGSRDFHFKLLTNPSPKMHGQRRFGAAFKAKGGMVGYHGGYGRQTRLSTTDFYTATDKVDSKHLDKNAPPESLQGRMCHTVTQLKKGSLLLVGGRSSPLTVFSDCWLNNGCGWRQVHSLPTPCFRQCAARVNLGDEEQVLIYGGKSSNGDVLGQFLLWNEQNGWRTVTPVGQAPEPRFGAILYAITQSSGVLFGGMSRDGVVLNDFWTWRFTSADDGTISIVLTNDTATVCNSESPISEWIGRFGATANILEDNKLTVLGGVTGAGYIPLSFEVIQFDLKCPRDSSDLNSCELTRHAVSAPGCAFSSRPLLIGHSSVSVGSDALLILGGGAVCFSFGSFWNQGVHMLKQASSNAPEWSILESPTQRLASSTHEPVVNSSKSSEISPDPVTVPRVKINTAIEFQAIIEASQPVLLEGLDIGLCIRLWNKDYLKSAVGADREVVVHESKAPNMDFRAKNFAYVTKKFGKFIDEVYSGAQQYLRSVSAGKPLQQPTNFHLDFPGLKDDFKLPDQLAIVSKNAHSSPLRISGPVTLWLHYDVMANVLCQISGEKKLILYPPSDVSHLAIAPGASSSSINVFQPGTHGESQVSVSPTGTHPHEASMRPGDILFIPPLWLHTASPSEKVSVSVNVFFHNLDTESYARGRDVYGNRDLEAYERGRKEVEKIDRLFDRLPGQIRQFYLHRLADELKAKADT